MKKYGETREIMDYTPGLPCNIPQCGEPSVARRRCQRHLHLGFNLRRFHMKLSDYLRMFNDQDGVCIICGGTNVNGYALSVDHDHGCCPGDRSCGACIRGLLCSNCNFAVGMMRDDPARLRAAADYLEARAVV